MSRLRRRLRILLLPLAAVAGVATAVVPSLASGTTSSASFTAVDFAWDVSGSGSTQATIAQGGTVSFGYPSGSSAHNADFGTGPQPSSCTQTAGPSSGSVPPLPHSPTSPGWSGTCTFNTAGTYTFHCDLHPFMTATVVVQGSGTTTGTTGTTTTTTTPPPPPPPPPTTTTSPPPPPTTTAPPPPAASTSTPTSTTPSDTTPVTGPTPTSGPSGSPVSGGAKAIIVAATQSGAAVRGSVRVSSAGAGGRLEVDLFLARRGHAHHATRVGRLVRSHLRAGRVRFSVALTATAKAMLRRQKRLPLTVRLTVASPAGARASATRRVVLLQH